MMSLVLLTVCWLRCLPMQTDSIVARSIVQAPVLDGRVSDREYGTPTVRFATAEGEVRVWVVRHGGFLHVAGTLPDSTFYWGDDFVISLDPLGDRTPGPGHDDTQWYFRRVLDSSVVNRGRHGRWMAPSDDPDWRLGKERSGDGWEVRGSSDAAGWSLELKLPALWFADDSGRTATMAILPHRRPAPDAIRPWSDTHLHPEDDEIGPAAA